MFYLKAVGALFLFLAAIGAVLFIVGGFLYMLIRAILVL